MKKLTLNEAITRYIQEVIADPDKIKELFQDTDSLWRTLDAITQPSDNSSAEVDGSSIFARIQRYQRCLLQQGEAFYEREWNQKSTDLGDDDKKAWTLLVFGDLLFCLSQQNNALEVPFPPMPIVERAVYQLSMLSHVISEEQVNRFDQILIKHCKRDQYHAPVRYLPWLLNQGDEIKLHDQARIVVTPLIVVVPLNGGFGKAKVLAASGFENGGNNEKWFAPSSRLDKKEVYENLLETLEKKALKKAIEHLFSRLGLADKDTDETRRLAIYNLFLVTAPSLQEILISKPDDIHITFNGNDAVDPYTLSVEGSNISAQIPMTVFVSSKDDTGIQEKLVAQSPSHARLIDIENIDRSSLSEPVDLRFKKIVHYLEVTFSGCTSWSHIGRRCWELTNTKCDWNVLSYLAIPISEIHAIFACFPHFTFDEIVQVCLSAKGVGLLKAFQQAMREGDLSNKQQILQIFNHSSEKNTELYQETERRLTVEFKLIKHFFMRYVAPIIAKTEPVTVESFLNILREINLQNVPENNSLLVKAIKGCIDENRKKVNKAHQFHGPVELKNEINKEFSYAIGGVDREDQQWLDSLVDQIFSGNGSYLEAFKNKLATTWNLMRQSCTTGKHITADSWCESVFKLSKQVALTRACFDEGAQQDTAAPHNTVLVGPPGSGKSKLSALVCKLNSKSVRLDPDEITAATYSLLQQENVMTENPAFARLLAMPSWVLTQGLIQAQPRIVGEAAGEKSKSSKKKVSNPISREACRPSLAQEDSELFSQVYFVLANPETVKSGIQARQRDTGRAVPEQYVYSCYKDYWREITEFFVALKQKRGHVKKMMTISFVGADYLPSHEGIEALSEEASRNALKESLAASYFNERHELRIYNLDKLIASLSSSLGKQDKTEVWRQFFSIIAAADSQGRELTILLDNKTLTFDQVIDLLLPEKPSVTPQTSPSRLAAAGTDNVSSEVSPDRREAQAAYYLLASGMGNGYDPRAVQDSLRHDEQGVLHKEYYAANIVFQGDVSVEYNQQAFCSPGSGALAELIGLKLPPSPSISISLPGTAKTAAGPASLDKTAVLSFIRYFIPGQKIGAEYLEQEWSLGLPGGTKNQEVSHVFEREQYFPEPSPSEYAHYNVFKEVVTPKLQAAQKIIGSEEVFNKAWLNGSEREEPFVSGLVGQYTGEFYPSGNRVRKWIEIIRKVAEQERAKYQEVLSSLDALEKKWNEHKPEGVIPKDDAVRYANYGFVFDLLGKFPNILKMVSREIQDTLLDRLEELFKRRDEDRDDVGLQNDPIVSKKNVWIPVLLPLEKILISGFLWRYSNEYWTVLGSVFSRTAPDEVPMLQDYITNSTLALVDSLIEGNMPHYLDHLIRAARKELNVESDKADSDVTQPSLARRIASKFTDILGINLIHHGNKIVGGVPEILKRYNFPVGFEDWCTRLLNHIASRIKGKKDKLVVAIEARLTEEKRAKQSPKTTEQFFAAMRDGLYSVHAGKSGACSSVPRSGVTFFSSKQPAATASPPPTRVVP